MKMQADLYFCWAHMSEDRFTDIEVDKKVYPDVCFSYSPHKHMLWYSLEAPTILFG